VLVTTTLFNALTVHVGETVLFKLPAVIPLFGGAITLEAAFYGLLNGLTLTLMFFAFSIINHALPARALIRLIPRAFYPVAIVIAIALTFVPATLRHFKQIQEAQAIRGHQWRGIRDWLPLLIPLLTGGLERALQLAEAMTARGFASQPSYSAKTQIAVILGLVFLLSGWLLRLVWSFPSLGLMIQLTGFAVIGLTIWIVGRHNPYTRYRPQPWQRLDSLVSVSAGVVFVLFIFDLPYLDLDRSSILYYPYPAITMPSLNPIIALVSVGLAMPFYIFKYDQTQKSKLHLS
jgi:energy-coupling factor transport system permease protein